MNYFLFFLLVLQLIENSIQIPATDEIPTPSPSGAICDQKLRNSPEMNECFGLVNTSFNNEIISAEFSDIREKTTSMLSSIGNKETDCCGFWTYFQCYLKHIPNVCIGQEALDAKEFIENYLQWLGRNRCKGTSTFCSKSDSDVDSLRQSEEEFLKSGLEKIHANNEVAKCRNGVYAQYRISDSNPKFVLRDELFCGAEGDLMQCDTKSMSEICTYDEVLAVQRYYENYRKQLNRSRCIRWYINPFVSV